MVTVMGEFNCSVRTAGGLRGFAPVCCCGMWTGLLALALLQCLTSQAATPGPAPVEEETEVLAHPWVVSVPNFRTHTYFTNIKDGDSREAPFVMRFGLSMRGIIPAGETAGRAGHHHLLVDRDLPLDFKNPLPFTDQYIHFGKGQMQAVINRSPGTYSFRRVFADQGHIPYFVYSDPVRVTITQQNAPRNDAAVLGPPSIEIISPADQAVVRGPFRVQFNANGYNLGHVDTRQPGTGHFRLMLDRPGKAAELLDFQQGQTEVWLNPPQGDYALRLERVGTDMQAGNTLMAKALPVRIKVADGRTP
jgi:hypothetical protein